MKRTKNLDTKPSAILTGDWHLREDTPICRTDDYWEAQWGKVLKVAELQEKWGCPVIHSGDLFNHWKPSPYLLTKMIQHLPDRFYTLYGNHDLPQHNLELALKSGIGTLQAADVLSVLTGVHWGDEPSGDCGLFFPKTGKNILMWHVMTYQGKEPWPGCTDQNAREILASYPDYPLIVTGHNHKSFVEEYEGRLLVNPGSLMRMSADQIDHKPCVYLWYEESNTVKQVILPHEKGVISRHHIEQKQEKEARYQAFIDRLQQEGDPELSFRKNLEKHFQQNKTIRSVKELIYEKIEE